MSNQAILDVVGDNPDGVQTVEICRALNSSPQSLGNVLEDMIKAGEIVSFAGLWFQLPLFRNHAKTFCDALGELHAEHPEFIGHSAKEVVSRIKRKWSGKPLLRMVDWMCEQKMVEGTHDSLRLRSFKITLTPKQDAFLKRIEEELVKTPVNTPYPSDIAGVLGVPIVAIEEVLRLGVSAGRIVEPALGVYFTTSQIESIQQQLKAWRPKGSFETGEVRDFLKTTRKYASPLLDYFDEIGFTVRNEDGRVIQKL